MQKVLLFFSFFPPNVSTFTVQYSVSAGRHIHVLRKFAWILQGQRSDWVQVGVICSNVYAVILCSIKIPVCTICHTELYVHILFHLFSLFFSFCLTTFSFSSPICLSISFILLSLCASLLVSFSFFLCLSFPL